MRAPCKQRDLFEPPRGATELPAELRAKLTTLLQVLLAEAAGIKPRRINTDGQSEEDGDDQDHA